MSYWRGPRSFEASKNKEERQDSDVKGGQKRALPNFEVFILVLICLKVGLFLTDLGDRFGISTGHASRIFTTWINFLYHELPLLFPFLQKNSSRN